MRSLAFVTALCSVESGNDAFLCHLTNDALATLTHTRTHNNQEQTSYQGSNELKIAKSKVWQHLPLIEIIWNIFYCVASGLAARFYSYSYKMQFPPASRFVVLFHGRYWTVYKNEHNKLFSFAVCRNCANWKANKMHKRERETERTQNYN